LISASWLLVIQKTVEKVKAPTISRCKSIGVERVHFYVFFSYPNNLLILKVLRPKWHHPLQKEMSWTGDVALVVQLLPSKQKPRLMLLCRQR
jgi:hypothetical protein